jgi:hypothetical protein
MTEQVYGHRKGRFVQRRVIIDHEIQLEFLASVLQNGRTDQSPAEFAHEIDHFRGGITGGGDEITFIFPVLIVNHYHHLAISDVLNGTFY